jgi:hypothetical protein
MPRTAIAHPPVPPGYVRVSWADAHTAMHMEAHAEIFERMSNLGFLTPDRDGYRVRLPRDEIMQMLLLGFQPAEEII